MSRLETDEAPDMEVDDFVRGDAGWDKTAAVVDMMRICCFRNVGCV